MLGDDRRQLLGAGSSHSVGPDAGVIGIEPIATSQDRPSSQPPIQQMRRERTEKYRDTAIDDRELGASLTYVVEQRGLLQKPAGISIEAAHGVEHVEAMTLVIDRQGVEEWRQRRPQDTIGQSRVLRSNPG